MQESFRFGIKSPFRDPWGSRRVLSMWAGFGEVGPAGSPGFKRSLMCLPSLFWPREGHGPCPPPTVQGAHGPVEQG